jgi:hypothetical protein
MGNGMAQGREEGVKPQGYRDVREWGGGLRHPDEGQDPELHGLRAKLWMPDQVRNDDKRRA